jgi:DUF2075 family protein
VIWGTDLVYDPNLGDWRGNPSASEDNVVKRWRDQFLPLVKNTYRVLLTRGMKCCYVYCQDAGTREFLASRIATDLEQKAERRLPVG